MSEYEQPVNAPAARSENGIGIAGFICSLLGIISCGLLSPVGLVLSIVGMFREPKGFAIAGLVLGLIGTLWTIIVAIIVATVGIAIIGVLGAVMASGFSLEAIEAWADGVQIRIAVNEHIRAHGDPPATLGELSGLPADTLIDPWGNTYRFEILDDGRQLRIISDGPDGLPETEDDLNLDFPLQP